MTDGSDFSIRSIRSGDRAAWEPLWIGYLEFYDKLVSPETIDFTWKQLTQCDQVQGLIAINNDGDGFGLAHYFFHASTSIIGGNCYMQDLFVAPASRRRGVGRELIAAVVAAAKARKAAVVYWQTEEFNGIARRLYERLAKRSPFIRYQIELR